MADNTSKVFSITDATGAVMQVASEQYREELWLRNEGPNTVYLGFNEDAVETKGFYLQIGDALIIAGNMANKDVYMVCASGGTASVFAELD